MAYLDTDEELAPWSISPVAAMLASAHRWRRDETSPDLLERVVTTCGDVAADLLVGKDDPFAAVGRFDSAEALAAMPPEQLDRLWRAARVVPGGVLDDGERLVAARELFDARLHSTVRGLAGWADRLLSELRPVIAQGGGQRCLAAVRPAGLATGGSPCPSCPSHSPSRHAWPVAATARRARSCQPTMGATRHWRGMPHG